MDQEIMVSVICNVYNHGRYLRDALDGFVNQKTNFAFEVLIHDDASTDNSADIIREYEQKYPDLIKPIYQKENQYSQNIPITRTYQIPRIKGKYVATCEGDDYWTDPMKLQKQFDFMEKNPEYSMCVCSVVWLDMQTNKRYNRCKTDVNKDVSLEDIILEKKGRIFQYATYFLRKEVFCSCPEWMRSFGVGDTPLAMNAALFGKVYMLADTMAVYRNRANGSWTARFNEDASYKVAAFQHMINGLMEFNKVTQYQYDKAVSFRIKHHKYNIGRVNRDVKVLRSEELREIYNSRGLKARMSDLLYCKTPRLQAFIMKILRR